VATEVALALVLLSGAGMLLDSARRLSRVDPGFDAKGVLHVRVSLPPEKYEARATQVEFYARVLDALLAVPGVEAAAAVNVPPGVGGDARPSVVLEGDPVPSAPADMRVANVRVVSSRYFETLRLAPRAGRTFSTAVGPSPPLALVNEAFSRRYFDGRMPIGRTLRVTPRTIAGLDATPRTIVGVVPDIREKTLYEPAPPTVYIPLDQADWRIGLRMALLIRSSRASNELSASVRAAVAAADGEQAAFGLMPLAELMESELSLHRLNLALLGVLSSVALFLAVVGVYGMSSQSVRQRTREIGIRTALGASPSGILRLVLLEGATLTLAGLAGGALISLWTARLLPSTIDSIGTAQPGTFVWAGFVLAAAVLAGCCLPARRAARIDPAIVLRSE
jgi:putative ABC transport system permease protein